MLCGLDQFQAIVDICRRSQVGKRLPDALYVHVSALTALDPRLQNYEMQAREMTPFAHSTEVITLAITLVKFSLEKPTVSYLDSKYRTKV